MSSSNCYFLTCIQVSQEAGQVVWYSHLLKNIPEFVVIHTVQGFGIVNKALVDIFFWKSLAFLMIQWMLAIWSLVPLPFLKPAGTSGSSWFTYCWSLAWRIVSITLPVRWVQLCGKPGKSTGMEKGAQWSGFHWDSFSSLGPLNFLRICTWFYASSCFKEDTSLSITSFFYYNVLIRKY